MPDIAQAHRKLDSNPALAQKARQSEKYKKLEREARRVKVGDRTFYVVEGDLLLDEVQLAQHALREPVAAETIVEDAGAGGRPAKLLGMTKDGKMLRWRPGLALTYCVDRETFPDQNKYSQVRDSVRTATEQWMAVCGVAFEYKPELDNDAAGREGKVLFQVAHFDAQGEFIAAAFFPDDPTERRVVLIDPSFYASSLTFDRVGVLRHELGHVLGFRHEHIRSGAPAVCPGEPLFETVDLTAYDPKSVMHYFCGGVGSRELAITELDTAGARRLYGLPLSSYTFVE